MDLQVQQDSEEHLEVQVRCNKFIVRSSTDRCNILILDVCISLLSEAIHFVILYVFLNCIRRITDVYVSYGNAITHMLFLL
jgi:hypothetical protein